VHGLKKETVSKQRIFRMQEGKAFCTEN